MKYTISHPQALNEVGQRDNNEDSVFPQKGMADLSDRLFIVCDGVGGIDKGEVASSLVCRSLSSSISGNIPDPATKEFFLKAFDEAQSAIDSYLSNSAESAGMATTLTLLSLNDSGATIMWCGDSRVYQIRNGEIVFKTEDHSFVAELVRSGIITPEQAATHPKKNVITRALQGKSSGTVKPDIFHQTDIKAGDVFFLCTDGILESINDENLLKTFTNGDTLNDAINTVYKVCNNNSRDNFSCYAVQIESVKGKSYSLADSDQEEVFTATVVGYPKRKKKLFGNLSLGIKILIPVIFLIISWAVYHFFIAKENPSVTIPPQKQNNESEVKKVLIDPAEQMQDSSAKENKPENNDKKETKNTTDKENK